MREIKFRAWDGKSMHQNVVIVDNKAYRRGYFANIFSPNAKAGIPMQYTGLKDKNSKEIYEGDIYHQGDKRILYVVVYHGASFIGKQVRSTSYAGLEAFQENIEVIGNRFDNPELLKSGDHS